MALADNPVHRYHEGTKHHFHQFARSLGYLDWASQPDLFRTFAGSERFALYPSPAADTTRYIAPRPTYDQLFDRRAEPVALSAALIGDVLRHALGLSAWKAYGRSRWSLRVNPSSGNLHPTETYVVCGPLSGLAGDAAVYHYAVEHHTLELRCRFDDADWSTVCGGRPALLIALTSIHWREAWKYGERAFRYCQHDLGHAIAALGLAATLVGWRVRLLSSWSHRAIARLAGIDRDEDYFEAEREEPGALLVVAPEAVHDTIAGESDALVAAVQRGRWSGSASQLSEDHVQWTFIDEVAAATEFHGRAAPSPRGVFAPPFAPAAPRQRAARTIVLQRRSALAFDGESTIDGDAFASMLARAMPAAHPPWDALWWTPRIHFLLFVHRVDGFSPGLYLLGRDALSFERLQQAVGRDIVFEPAHRALPLVRIAHGDCRSMARRLSCDQDIAADGFFSFGMIAEFDRSLAEDGPAFYRNLFWESGVIGQVMYLEAEAAGARATGIGCFYDDPVHRVLGVADSSFQSLYHFSVGIPVEDVRLTTETGYPWG